MKPSKEPTRSTNPQDARATPRRRIDDNAAGATDEPRDESAAESLGRAITEPMRDAAEPEDRRQTGKH